MASGAWQWAPPADDGAGDGSGDESEAPADGGGYADTDPSALSDFRATLDPYGTWTDDPNYGTVWVPSPSVVGSDFTPYVSAGHWVYDNDYAWVSDYDWGWAPFHYGRWIVRRGLRVGVDPRTPVRRRVGVVALRSRRLVVRRLGAARAHVVLARRRGRRHRVRPARALRVRRHRRALRVRHRGRAWSRGPQVGVIASHTRPYVPATPAVGGRVAARPAVGGPSPHDLHIAPESVARSAADNRGLLQARAYARPATAVSLGARAPAGVAVRAAPAAFARGGVSGGLVPVAGPARGVALRRSPARRRVRGERRDGRRRCARTAVLAVVLGACRRRRAALLRFDRPPRRTARALRSAVRRRRSVPTRRRRRCGRRPAAAFHPAPAAGGFRPSPGFSGFRPSPGVAGVHTGGGAAPCMQAADSTRAAAEEVARAAIADDSWTRVVDPIAGR